MKAKIQEKYEIVMIYVIATIDLIEDLFVLFYPGAGPLIGVFLLIGFAGNSDMGGSTSDFMHNVLITAFWFVILTLLYKYLKLKRGDD